MGASKPPPGLLSPTPTMKLMSIPQGPAKTDKTRLVTLIVVVVSLLVIFGWQADLPYTVQLMTTPHASISAPELWLPPEGGERWKPCVKKKAEDPGPSPLFQNNGIAYIYLDGGLGQQAWELCHGVVLAKILDMTLILPSLTMDPYWQDNTPFGSIFDIQHFVATLKDDINMTFSTDLPPDLQAPPPLPETKWRDYSAIYKGKPEEYRRQVLPIAKEAGVVQFVGMWGALDDDALSLEERKLACRAKFQALKFTEPILKLGNALVRRMRRRAGGPFLALHLRFEEDMLAHSGCHYWGGQEEQNRWAAMRAERTWPEPTKTDSELRDLGKCPPTPLEVAMWLKGLGFPKTTRIYLAAGKMYDEKKSMEPFYRRFPHVYTKDVLLSVSEKSFVAGKSNMRAAVDMHVLTHADVTALTFEGMMGETVQGLRKWNGHQKTLKAPVWGFNRFDNKTWFEYQKQIREWTYLEAGDGGPMRRQDRSWSEELFANPVPDCMCEQRVAQNSVEERG